MSGDCPAACKGMPLSSSVWDSVARERYPYFPADRRAHMRVLAHGGAGSAPDEPAARQAVLDAASRAGADARTPEAAVVATVRHLESDPRFNAGVGSAVQSDGVARTDAGLMTGDGASGAEGADPATAARQTIDRFAARTGGTAGVIVLDGSGATGRAHNARAMQTARRGEQ